ncbi:MAG: glycosyltransferase family 2 protein [Oscillospiraceae bacterium]|nr:glycosyltransferase family 2 protein [Oscillospiraceae bacterium]
MQNDYVLTIAVPNYNGARTIRSMLDIMLPQCTEEVEVLISDNCSTDKTPQIIAEYKEKYPFIRTIRNSENIGADGNFLQCMQMAQGKWTMLISDDDIIVEGAVDKILTFLKSNSEVTLAYLSTVSFKDRYVDISSCSYFKKRSKKINQDYITTDKKRFFSYIQRQWGFTSCFLWKTERFKDMKNPQQFLNTYWLQSYVHIECSKNSTDELGLISGPCIAVGSYGAIGNYDVAEVEGVYYKKMLDYAVMRGGTAKSSSNRSGFGRCVILRDAPLLKNVA